MDKPQKTVSRNIGIEIGAICGKYFLKSQHLHYGYWTSDLQVNIASLPIAQENYANFLISHIPDGVRTILDVGCGLGQIPKKLVDMGYQVDCVSPSPFLSNQARELLGNTSHIFECYYEQLQTENRYDLILFSESFQYIDIEEAIKKTLGFLNQSGYILICDFFKKESPYKSPLSGGHPLTRFYNIVYEYPLEPIKDLDITKETAPNLDIANDMLKEVIEPTANLAQQLLDNRYPFTSKFLKWMYRKKINKLNKKYFSGERTGENFKKFKSYRLLLYEKINLKKAWQLDFRDAYLENVGSKFEEKNKLSAITRLANSRRFESVLNYLRKQRTLALKLVFPIIIIENILNGKKPHELGIPDISIMAVIGLIFVLSGVFIRFWARGHFTKGRLFTTGPYALVRHPLYLGSFLVVCGVLFQLNGWLFNWGVIIPSFVVFYGAAIIYEERSLEKKFGKQWQLYKAKTPAIIPSLQNWLLPRETFKWSWKTYLSTHEAKVTLILLSLPLLIELMEDFVFESMLGI